MDHLPALLAAMYRAPACSSLRGTVRYWTDHERRMERMRQPQRGATIFMVAGGAGTPTPESRLDIWVRGDRLRYEQHGQVTIVGPRERLHYTPGHGAVRMPVGPHELFDHPRWLWSPRRLIDAIDIAAVQPGERLGRAVWEATGTADGADRPGMFVLVLAGDHYRFDIDQATGAVLAMHISSREGETLDDIEWTDFEPDAVIDDAVFELTLPAGERVRSVNELRLDGLAREGVDTSGVDPDDDDAVNALLEQRRPWRSTLDPLAQVVTTGDPPADVDAARTAIERAFREIGERDGDRLVNVQAGAGLAPYLDQAREKVTADLRVERVKFVNDREAIANVEIVRPDGGPNVMARTMRAVIEDGSWKVERSDLTSLLRMVGVYCPPPEG